MIAKLTGTLDSILSDHLIIDVNGIGYLVYASTKTLARFSNVGEKIILFIEHIIRQDNQILCGFYDENERTCFRSLLGVQGVGVKVALAILSILTPDELVKAIFHQDKAILMRADGVGAKVAGRIVLELKDKNQNLSATITNSTSSSNIQDALAGLIGLGYSKSEAAFALSKVSLDSGEDSTAATLIRLALQGLASSKIING
jgi:Holliday junction DNA helicase RuvA